MENVAIISKAFRIPQLRRRRRIWAYLPPNYHTTSKKRFRVVYMLDAQNLFDHSTAAFGNVWGVQNTMHQLHRQGHEDAIIIGIDHAGKNRIVEFAPPFSKHKGKKGQGAEFADFLANSLKPHIDKKFRTLPERENTALFGSSMGGLFALYAGFQHQDVFGKLGIFSPALWFAPRTFDYVQQIGKHFPAKVFLLAGKKEGVAMSKLTEGMYHHLKNNVGLQDHEVKLDIHPDGEHSEWFWGREFPYSYRWLFS